MEDKVEWNDDFLTGIDEIDEQHKEIIESVNNIYQAIEDNKSKETIIDLIKNLDFYTNSHFDIEEKYMRMFNYGGYSEHKKTHDFFKNTYEQIRFSYYYVGDDRTAPKYELARVMALHLSQILMDWLNLHLNTFDKEFAAFIRSKKQGE